MESKDKTFWTQFILLLLGIHVVLISTTVYLANQSSTVANELKLKEIDFFQDQNIPIDLNGNNTVALNSFQESYRQFFDTKINAATDNKTRFILSDILMIFLFFCLVFIKPLVALASKDYSYDFERLQFVPWFWFATVIGGIMLSSIYFYGFVDPQTGLFGFLSLDLVFVAVFIFVADVLFLQWISKVSFWLSRKIQNSPPDNPLWPDSY